MIRSSFTSPDTDLGSSATAGRARRHIWLIRWFLCAVVVCTLLVSSFAEAAPRSGGSIGGLRGFRSSPSRGFSRSVPATRNYGGGSSFVFLPSFGWGYGGGFGFGGGMGMVGSLVLVGLLCVGTVLVVRSIRRAANRNLPAYGDYDDHEEATSFDRAYVYKVQVGLGRSGRGIQKRLEEFASTGDTSSEAGLADLLHQTALELMREKDAIRYALVEPSGPFSLTNGEAKLTGAATAERSRFQTERVRGSEGVVRRSESPLTVGSEALEYLVVTVLLATRSAITSIVNVDDRQTLESVLGTLGGVPADALLGLEIIWTPADPDDSLTETDLMTTYPELRSI